MGRSSVTSVATRSRRWTPERYFLNNDFCPPELILDRLDRLRYRTGADWVLLVTVGRYAPLKSLTMLSAASAQLRRRFEVALANGNFRDGAADLRTDAEAAIEWVVQTGLLDPAMPAVASRLDDGVQDGEALSVWLFTSPDSAEELHAKTVRRLAVMVNATAVAHSNRDHRVTAMVRGTRRETEDRAGDLAALPLLRIATEVVPNAQAALYLYEPTSGKLRLTEVSGDSGTDYPTDGLTPALTRKLCRPGWVTQA